jgi:hypothetical protein
LVGVGAGGVVGGDGLEDLVAVAFVEGEGGVVVGGGFESDGVGAGGVEAKFGGAEELGAEAGAAGGGEDVDGDDVSGAGGMGEDEAGDELPGCFASRRTAPSTWLRASLGGCLHMSIRVLCGDEGEGAAAAHEVVEFGAGVGDGWGETLLVDAPEGFEIVGSGVAEGEGHEVFYWVILEFGNGSVRVAFGAERKAFNREGRRERPRRSRRKPR